MIFLAGITAYYSIRDLFIFLRGELYITNLKANRRNEYIFLAIYALIVIYFGMKEKDSFSVITTGLIYIVFRLKALLGEKTMIEVYNIGKEEIALRMTKILEQKKIEYRLEAENQYYLPFENLTFEIKGSKNHAKLDCIKEYKDLDCAGLVDEIMLDLERDKNQNFKLAYQQLLKSTILFVLSFVLFFYFIF